MHGQPHIKLSLVGGPGFGKRNCSKKRTPRRRVCANQPIYFITQSVTTINLAVASEFNYDLIMSKEILINKFHLFHEHFLLLHYLNRAGDKIKKNEMGKACGAYG